MGQYFQFVCIHLRERHVVMRLSPLSLGASLKWGCYIGTPKGDAMLDLLRSQFCPPDCEWVVFGDEGHKQMDFKDMDYKAVAEKCHDMPDVGFNAAFRKLALEKKLTSEYMLGLGDNWAKLCAELRVEGADEPDYIAPNSDPADLSAFLTAA